MPFDSKLTTDDKFLIFQMASEGHYVTDMVKATGNKVTKQRIHQLLRKNGYNPVKVRVAERDKVKEEHLNNWYGSFFRDGVIDDNEELISLARAKFRNKKANARCEFTIEFKDIQWNTHCPVLGMALDYKAAKTQENSVSFDRLDPNKGYVPGNVFIISWRANRIKNDGNAEEHRLISNFLFQHQR